MLPARYDDDEDYCRISYQLPDTVNSWPGNVLKFLSITNLKQNICLRKLYIYSGLAICYNFMQLKLID